jgi:hypothetical protein
MTVEHINASAHPITRPEYVEECRSALNADGALVLDAFFSAESIAEIIAASAPHEPHAYYANSTHNVYLTDNDPDVASDHPRNRQIVSSKGLIADDAIPAGSPLRAVYDDDDFRSFLCGVLGISAIHPYDDDLSSINVHFAAEGMELGWHFDNSAFAVTMLLQAPEGGGVFEYVPQVRNADAGDQAYEAVGQILDGVTPVETLSFEPGALVLFRGRDAMHRVTPTEGDTTRLLVVFAFNDEPNVKLSDSALMTFYGRLA